MAQAPCQFDSSVNDKIMVIPLCFLNGCAGNFKIADHAYDVRIMGKEFAFGQIDGHFKSPMILVNGGHSGGE
jgi:hypothetical protein